ncbi:MAG TPA: hypothetical protein VJ783_16875 [Pirellulales bacterium]|nr:hypothetical protein [Pirellulales bacterium]
MLNRRCYRCWAVAVLALAPGAAFAGQRERESKTDKRPYTTESIQGRVVWMSDALKERFNIHTDDDAAAALVALEEPDGRLHPIVKDQRGRCFYTDERLRDIDVELFVRRYSGSPMLQVVRVYTIKSGKKYELDYWCDVCSIPMYELKPCECCQGPTRLRERLVEKSDKIDATEPDAKPKPNSK